MEIARTTEVHGVLLGLVIGLAGGVFIGYLWAWLFSHSNRKVDEADERRKLFLSNAANDIKVPKGITHYSEWQPNARGVLIYRQQFVPKKIKAVIGMCHGFGDHTNTLLTDLAIRLAQDGYAVVTMDFEGHGLSDGLHASIQDFNILCDDIHDYFVEMLEHRQFRSKPFFLYGESMGGAVVFNLCTSSLKARVTGAAMSAPMVKISDELRPPAIIIEALTLLEKYFPYAPIIPTKDILEYCFRNRSTLDRIRSCPLNYMLRPRLRSGLVCLRTTNDIASRMQELDLPVLIMHGALDKVTCPKVSSELYFKCSSSDKTLKIYPNCWHALLHDELEEEGREVYTDLVQWLDARC